MTTGPWEVRIGAEFCFARETHGTYVSIVERWTDEDEEGESTVAEVWPADEGRAEADGRLIAAAPELLAAVRNAERYLVALTADVNDPRAVELREVIAKVEA